jgi:hypothetical protein
MDAYSEKYAARGGIDIGQAASEPSPGLFQAPVFTMKGPEYKIRGFLCFTESFC